LNGYRLPQFLLYEVGVRPKCRNRGVGEALVAEFAREAQAAGAFEVWVVTSPLNKAAMAMYERCGLGPEIQNDVAVVLNKGFDSGTRRVGVLGAGTARSL
jgi:ribosomal protein S18 acetylase RimI-like enzyme